MSDVLNDAPVNGFLRLNQIVGRKADPKKPHLPEIQGIIPISRSMWWDGVKSGKYPKGIKLSATITVWKVEDIRDLVDRLSGNN